MKIILVVDDDVELLLILKLYLERKNFFVNAISKWENLEASISACRPDLILLDIHLNGADGRAICNQLKIKKDTEEIPVILFSSDYYNSKNFFKLHADGFIAKRFDILELIAKINDVLSAKSNAFLNTTDV